MSQEYLILVQNSKLTAFIILSNVFDHSKFFTQSHSHLFWHLSYQTLGGIWGFSILHKNTSKCRPEKLGSFFSISIGYWATLHPEPQPTPDLSSLLLYTETHLKPIYSSVSQFLSLCVKKALIVQSIQFSIHLNFIYIVANHKQFKALITVR